MALWIVAGYIYVVVKAGWLGLAFAGCHLAIVLGSAMIGKKK